MNERDFYYWLRGFFELTESEVLDARQVKMIKKHMDLVATKVTSPASPFDAPVTCFTGIDPTIKACLTC